MNLYSTVDSADNLEFSWVALIESLLAVSLSLWIAWEFQTILHIVIATCIAPLLLFRTKKSMEAGFKSFNFIFSLIKPLDFVVLILITILAIFLLWLGLREFFEFYGIFGIVGFIFSCILGGLGLLTFSLIPGISSVRSTSDIGLVLVSIIGVISLLYFLVQGYAFIAILSALGAVLYLFIILFTGVLLTSLLSKFFATAGTVIRFPKSSISAIPKNWYRIVFCVDSFYPPELMAGTASRRFIDSLDFPVNKLLFFSNWANGSVYDDKGTSRTVKTTVLFIGVILFLPALLYRWSLKSSSLIWLPLIWIIGREETSSNDENLKLKTSLEEISQSAWSKVTAVYAFIVIFLFTLLPIYFIGLGEYLKSYFAQYPVSIEPIITYFFAFQFHAWHWSRLAVAVLTLIGFFYADKLLIKRKYNKNAGLKITPYLLRTLTLLKVPLSLFTITCGFYLLFDSVDWQNQFQSMLWLPNGLREYLLSLVR